MMAASSAAGAGVELGANTARAAMNAGSETQSVKSENSFEFPQRTPAKSGRGRGGYRARGRKLPKIVAEDNDAIEAAESEFPHFFQTQNSFPPPQPPPPAPPNAANPLPAAGAISPESPRPHHPTKSSNSTITSRRRPRARCAQRPAANCSRCHPADAISTPSSPLLALIVGEIANQALYNSFYNCYDVISQTNCLLYSPGMIYPNVFA